MTALEEMPGGADGVEIIRADPLMPEIRDLVAELDAFLFSLYPDGPDYLTPVEELAGTGAGFFLAREGDRALGCVALRPSPGYGEVKRMYVRPEARGRHLGLRLLRAVEQEALRLELPCLKLETGEPQTAAVRLYEREGFVRCGAFGDYPSCGGSLFMEKSLTP